jgi:hypothetical protein
MSFRDSELVSMTQAECLQSQDISRREHLSVKSVPGQTTVVQRMCGHAKKDKYNIYIC